MKWLPFQKNNTSLSIGIVLISSSGTRRWWRPRKASPLRLKRRGRMSRSSGRTLALVGFGIDDASTTTERYLTGKPNLLIRRKIVAVVVHDLDDQKKSVLRQNRGRCSVIRKIHYRVTLITSTVKAIKRRITMN